MRKSAWLVRNRRQVMCGCTQKTTTSEQRLGPKNARMKDGLVAEGYHMRPEIIYTGTMGYPTTMSSLVP